MLVVALFVFSLLYLSPGDPAVVIGGDTATAEDIARIREKLGLDRPFLVQFGGWRPRSSARRSRTCPISRSASRLRRLPIAAFWSVC